MSVTAGVSDTALAVRDKLRGKIGQTKVKRYWPGKAPDWAEEVDEDGDIRMARSEAVERLFPHHDHDGGAISDPRIRRLAESRVDNRKEAMEDHRRIRKAEIISTEAEEMQELAEADDEDEEAMVARRRRIKEKLLEREREEMEMQQGMAEEEEEEEEKEEEEEESEYETDSEEDVMGVAMLKPVFVPKAERDTVAERERMEEEERAMEEKVRKKLEERKVETKQILVEEIKKEEMIQKNLEMEAEIADVDTDDDNGAEDYEAWKVREIGRIKRDREARDAMVKEREEVERVRNMTEEERREWERKNAKPTAAQSSKQKWRFMQKYYHKGAFFQDEADDQAATAGTDQIYRRDFSAPTGEDRMDKSILPKVMQVKHFGRSGRTKWTHLVNEDTTDWNNPWTFNDPLRAKYNAKMAGMNTTIEKPKGSKKLKDWETR